MVSSIMLAYLKEPPKEPYILKSLKSGLSKIFKDQQLFSDILKELPT
jgi:hypothetical protein